MYDRTTTGLYVPRHRIIDQVIPQIKITTDYLPNHEKNPLLVKRTGDITLLVQHEGGPAEGIIPHFLTDLTIPEQDRFFGLFPVDAPLEAIRADWRRHLSHLLWMRSTRENIPPEALWE
ncbi:hypothetical protein [Streptomonospora nanhaiensis]|uniref:hypothetical protein n=1 Tax=Streptomonospora nanhaiensis TaxID=1323731 RepID=UPI001C3820FF|nr:hypothetical protein [Streptomonospora nanhaiensis]MBV2366936.1 hypothetical protein [Streptomonospora nanhaiensis]